MATVKGKHPISIRSVHQPALKVWCHDPQALRAACREILPAFVPTASHTDLVVASVAPLEVGRVAAGIAVHVPAGVAPRLAGGALGQPDLPPAPGAAHGRLVRPAGAAEFLPAVRVRAPPVIGHAIAAVFLLAAVAILQFPVFILTEPVAAIAYRVVAPLAPEVLHADPAGPHALSAPRHPVVHPPSHLSLVTVGHCQTVLITSGACKSLPVQARFVRSAHERYQGRQHLAERDHRPPRPQPRVVAPASEAQVDHLDRRGPHQRSQPRAGDVQAAREAERPHAPPGVDDPEGRGEVGVGQPRRQLRDLAVVEDVPGALPPADDRLDLPKGRGRPRGRGRRERDGEEGGLRGGQERRHGGEQSGVGGCIVSLRVTRERNENSSRLDFMSETERRKAMPMMIEDESCQSPRELRLVHNPNTSAVLTVPVSPAPSPGWGLLTLPLLCMHGQQSRPAVPAQSAVVTVHGFTARTSRSWYDLKPDAQILARDRNRSAKVVEPRRSAKRRTKVTESVPRRIVGRDGGREFTGKRSAEKSFEKSRAVSGKARPGKSESTGAGWKRVGERSDEERDTDRDAAREEVHPQAPSPTEGRLLLRRAG
ncbi:hypothetical protein THAOC_03781, partial [Thalassiosira oceanica]